MAIKYTEIWPTLLSWFTSMALFQNDVNHPSGSGETGFTLQTIDKTMKFVTTTIQGVRKWSEYRDQVPLTFEIFGEFS